MVMIYKATPRPILKGIKDESGRQLPAETTQLPQHLPTYFVLSQKSDQVNIVGPVAAKALYGDATFDQLSDYYTHQTVGVNTSFKNANQAMIVPIKLPGATKSSIRLGVELAAATVDGKDVTRVIWHATPFNTADKEGFMQGEIEDTYRAGDTTSSLSSIKLGALVDGGTEYYAPSAYFPIIDMEVESSGSYGNDLAFTIDAPTMRSPVPSDSALVDTFKTFVYRPSRYTNVLNVSTRSISEVLSWW